MNIILRFSSFGLIHCDFNEFNIMITEEGSFFFSFFFFPFFLSLGKVTVIDFPQMVSVDHENAQFYFERDVDCIVTYFEKRYDFVSEFKARWEDVKVGDVRLDKLVKASGKKKERKRKGEK